MTEELRPGSVEDAAEVLRALGERQASVRFVGGGTKLAWGGLGTDPDARLHTTGMSGIVEHNAADLTVVVDAGTPLAELQDALAESGQMLALDPPDRNSTVGGVVATGDSGPLRHRYGAPRDLLLGMTVVLSDGTIARSGGKVIKNVAGYDLAKLFAGSYGTLGLIARVALRLHARPPATATTGAIATDAEVVGRAAVAVTHAPLEATAVDVSWDRGVGRALARFGGGTARVQAERAVALMAEAGGDAEVVDDDDDLWNEQRTRQRASEGVVVRVSCVQTEIARVLAAAERMGASVVGRAGGLAWVTMRDADPSEAVGRVEELRRDLAPLACVVLDAPEEVRAKLDVWATNDDGAVDLMRRVKNRFDPAGICNPGIFVGGI
jgi:glycolate oxidase FAD binding subunit